MHDSVMWVSNSEFNLQTTRGDLWVHLVFRVLTLG